MGFEVDLNALKNATENRVVMMGNIPPRDVLAAGNPNDVHQSTQGLLTELKHPSMMLFSCGGGMPPGAPTENIQAFIETVQNK